MEKTKEIASLTAGTRVTGPDEFTSRRLARRAQLLIAISAFTASLSEAQTLSQKMHTYNIQVSHTETEDESIWHEDPQAVPDTEWSNLSSNFTTVKSLKFSLDGRMC